MGHYSFTRYLLTPFLFLFLMLNSSEIGVEVDNNIGTNAEDNIKGLNFVAPPKEFAKNPMDEVKEINAEWIAVIPYAFTRKNQPSVRYNTSNWQWWGERPEGAKETIRLAKEKGIKILLKPQVYIPGSWPGGLDFSSSDWELWEDSYKDYIMTFAKLAQEMNAEMFCVGTEFKISTRDRSQFWEDLISDIKKVYTGKLTYASNWDEYKHITFWKELDFIGIDAYFPLVDSSNPSVKEVVKAWNPIISELHDLYEKWDKKILFTEFGYLSVDRCTFNNWELEANIKSHPVNQEAQSNALDGLFSALWDQECWAGGFLWKWYPNKQGNVGYHDRDYTPQGKLAEITVRDWYAR